MSTVNGDCDTRLTSLGGTRLVVLGEAPEAPT